MLDLPSSLAVRSPVVEFSPGGGGRGPDSREALPRRGRVKLPVIVRERPEGPEVARRPSVGELLSRPSREPRRKRESKAGTDRCQSPGYAENSLKL